MKRAAKVILPVLAVLVLAFIWGHSIVPMYASEQESSIITEYIVAPVWRALTGSGDVSDEVVRKIAHVVEYAVLGFIATLCLSGKKALTVFSYCGCAALVDETIQLVSGRGDMVLDIWIDMAGVLPGVLLGSIIRRIRKR